jgi:hypothetical protein
LEESEVSLPPEVPQPDNRTDAQPATADQLENVKREMTGFERSTVRLAQIALGISILAAIFVCLQWWEMHEGGIDTHALAEATGDASRAASDQADAAQQFSDTAEDINERMSDAVEQLEAAANNAKASIGATQRAMRLDQRAWIVWKAISGAPTLDKPWKLDTYFTNTGRTPAKNVKVFCRAQPAIDETEVDFSAAVFEKRSTIIAPNDANTFCSLNPMTIPKVTQDVLDIFSTKTKVEFIYGFVIYDDIFGQKHWLSFCRAMEPDGQAWNACATHNDTGDGEPPKEKHRKPNWDTTRDRK